MNIKNLINRLEQIKDKDKICVISNGRGWANIEKIIEKDSTLEIIMEKYPIFSDN